MSATEGRDLAAEILKLINDNWNTSAFSPKPVLVHKNSKRIWTTDNDYGERTSGTELRTAGVVEVFYGGNTKEPEGTEFNYDITAEVDVTVQAVLSKRASVPVDSPDDFEQLVGETQNAINTDRVFPLTGLDDRYSYRDLRITGEVPEPIEEDNRDYFHREFTVVLRGREEPA